VYVETQKLWREILTQVWIRASGNVDLSGLDPKPQPLR